MKKPRQYCPNWVALLFDTGALGSVPRGLKKRKAAMTDPLQDFLTLASLNSDVKVL
jgi:hypothetical protein